MFLLKRDKIYNFAMENNACTESVSELVKISFFADTMCTEVAYVSVHAFGRGDIHIENTSCHVFIHNVIPKDSYFVI